MKKTLFTVCSVVAVCAAVFMACTKEDDGKTKVSYASQSTYGSGNNPNPNNNPSSSGYSTGSNTSTTTSPPPPTCTKSLTFDGTACSGVSSNISGNTVIESAGCGSVLIAFSGTSAPTAGTYSIVISSPIAGQCTFSG